MASRIVLVDKPRFFLMLIGTFLIFLFSVVPYLYIKKSPRNPYTKGLEDKIIILDAGHGGVDPGAQESGLKEKDITIKIVRRLEKLLRQKKIEVLLTRTEESGIIPKEIMNVSTQNSNLEERKFYALDKQASLFLSVHVNSFPSKEVSGGLVYYQNKNKHFKALAESIQVEINKLYSRKWMTKEADFVVINNTEMPSVLVEIGFISNPRDREYLTSNYGQEMIAKAIMTGLENYGGNLGE